MDLSARTGRGRHDLVIPKAPGRTRRVVVRSFDVDGPSAMVDRFVAIGAHLQSLTPLRHVQSEAEVRSRLSSAFGWYRTGTARHFVASIDGVDLGRCSAMLDPAQRDPIGRPLGLVGQWECEGGERGLEAAHALLELAVAWLRGNGAIEVVGPVDFATWYGYRFCDGRGDGRAPHLTEPVSADHSIGQWESFGFVRDETYFSAEIAAPQEQYELSRPLVSQLLADGWRIRQLRLREWEETLARVHELSMREFTRQPYFTPIPLEDFLATYEQARAAIDPRYVFSAWSPDEQLAGFILGIRDLACARRELAAGGRGARLRAARAAWRADTMLVKTICVAKPYRELGVSILLQHALYTAAFDTGHERTCNLLMHANARSRMLTELAGGVEFRSYVTLRLT